MGKKRRTGTPASTADKNRNPPSEDELRGPPARETIVMRTDRERAAEETLAEHTASSPRLTGGDVDADWQRADSVGEEAVGGSVATPDQSVVDDLGDALGVSRPTDAEFRTSAEILEERDRDRWERDEGEGGVPDRT